MKDTGAEYSLFLNNSSSDTWYESHAPDGSYYNGAGEDSFFFELPQANSTEAYPTDTYVDMQGPEPLPIYARVIITIMYSTITLVAVGGNGIVCYIVLAYQKMRTVTNFFIVNLACADLLVAILCIPFTFIANLLLEYWPFGAVMCPVINYAQVVTVFLSAFTLVAISLDRFVAVICPLRPKLTTRQAGAVIAVIWMLSLAVPLPIAILSRIVEREDMTGEMREYCEEAWEEPVHRWVYSMVIMVLQYFLPLFVLTFTYTWIGIVIWVKKTPGEAQNIRDQRMAASKRKMIKMMMTVVIIYALCWLPLHIVTLVGDTHPEIWGFRYIQVVWIGCHWLAMSNCCYNPMVYCWMNSRFRSGFKYVFRWCPCVDIDSNNAAMGGKKVQRMHTFVAKIDMDPTNGNASSSAMGKMRAMGRGGRYSPTTRGGLYQGETYSSYYSNESIAMQPQGGRTPNGNVRDPSPLPCRLSADRTCGGNNFNGYERLPLSNGSEMS